MPRDGEVDQMIKKNILTVFIMLFTFTLSFSAQASWKIKSAYKKAPGLEVDRSVLYFTFGDVTKIYAPNEAPLGLISSDKYVTPKGEFYLTGWAKGAQSVLFRVFDMSKAEAKPICEITSYGETSKLKIKEGVLYLKKFDSLEQAKPTWKACAKIKSSL
jgi:hypothetical protein